VDKGETTFEELSNHQSSKRIPTKATLAEKRSQSQLTSYTRPGRKLKATSPRKPEASAMPQEMTNQARPASAPAVSNAEREKFMT